MTQQADIHAPVDAASVWEDIDPRELLGEAARNIGVGTSTDQGWAPQVTSLIPPIGMTGGIPDATRLPAEDLMAAVREAVQESAADALRYGGTLGFEGLRTALAERSQAMDGLPQAADNFIITNGSSAAIDLVYRTFLQPGDIVVAESPSFSGSLRTIRGNLGRIEPVAMDGDGMDVEDLDRVLTRLESMGTPAKLMYTVPDYHNPTGTNLTLERRRKLIEVASRHRMLILEDDAYIDLYFDEQPLPSIYALAGGRGVLRAGSFSKTIATGLRTGWVQARADYVQLCNQMRFDMGGSPLIHRALARYVAAGQWEEHSTEMRELYAAKCDAISAALIDECEPYMTFVRPQGGFFLWLQLRPGLSARRVVDTAAAGGLTVVPGHHFFLDKSEDRNIRIAFSQVPISAMPEAAKRLRLALEKVADEAPAAAEATGNRQ